MCGRVGGGGGGGEGVKGGGGVGACRFAPSPPLLHPGTKEVNRHYSQWIPRTLTHSLAANLFLFLRSVHCIIQKERNIQCI